MIEVQNEKSPLLHSDESLNTDPGSGSEPRRVSIGGREGTFFPADGNIKWDYVSYVPEIPQGLLPDGEVEQERDCGY